MSPVAVPPLARSVVPALAAGAALVAVPTAGAAELVQEWDLSEDDGNFRSDGNKLQWEWGPVASGPGTGLGGASAWATILDAAHLQSADDTLQLATVDLTGTTAPVLQLDHWYALEDGADLGTLEIFTSGGWQAAEPLYGYPPTEASSGGAFTGQSGGWVTHWLDLAGLSSTGQVRLRFQSNETVPLAGWYVGAVTVWDGDPVPPYLAELTELEDTTLLGTPFPVEATVLDDRGEVSAVLEWQIDDGAVQAAPMTAQGGDRFQAELAAQDQPDRLVTWWITATDEAGNTSTSEPASFRVYLPAPRDLQVPAGRLIGTSTTLSWEAPSASDPVLSYEVIRDGADLVAEVEDTEATVPLDNTLHTFEVAAVFDTPAGVRTGDRSEVLGVAVTLPEIDALDPAESWQGTVVRVAVTGETLLLEAGAVELELGEGIEVSAVDVVNADRLEALLSIADDAPTGLRDLVLRSGEVELVRESAFQVLDGSWAPRLTGLDPEVVEQGSHVTVRVRANTTLEELPVVDLGGGIIVESVSLEEPDLLALELAVSNDAPLGLHAVTVDDGVQLLDGVSLRVRDQTPTAAPVCGCGAGPAGGLLGLLGGLGLLLRRRRPA